MELQYQYVYVTFWFKSLDSQRRSKLDGTDTLTSIDVSKRLEGCLQNASAEAVVD